MKCVYAESGGGRGGGRVSWRQLVPTPPLPPLKAHKHAFVKQPARFESCLIIRAFRKQNRQMTQPECNTTVQARKAQEKESKSQHEPAHCHATPPLQRNQK